MLKMKAKSFLGITPKMWILLVFIFLFSPICDLIDNEDQYFHNVLWFAYLIPTIIIVFQKGKLYGFFFTAFETTVFVLVEMTDGRGFHGQEIIAILELIILNILVSYTVGKLVKENGEKHFELRETKNLLESIFNNLDIAIWSDNLKEKLLLSKGIEHIYGQNREEAINCGDFWKKSIYREDKNIASLIDEKLKKAEDYVFEYRILRPDGEVRWIRDRGIPVFTEDGALERFDGVIFDITDKVQAKAELEHLAYHDELTGLANMNYLHHTIAKDFNEVISCGLPVCLMFFNLDRFKLINDTFGHRAGDHLLAIVSKKLLDLLRDRGTVVRSSGDDFIIYLPKMNRTQAEDFARLLLTVFSEPLQLNKQEIRIAASIGIAIPEQNDTLDDTVQKASAALHFAKEYGRNQFRFYSDEFGKIINRRLQLEQRLRTALEQEKFEIYFQPKLHLVTNKITGMEVLIRWHDPVLGGVSPVEFIPLAEETGMIIPIGKWVLEASCKQNFEWQRNGYTMQVCVNISSRQFLQDDFVVMVEKILAESGLSPQLLNLEITEGIALYNIDDAIEKLSKLKKIGVSVSLDDFGTGYSSLSYIKSLPIDFLKIDRAFISGIVENNQDAKIIQSIISLAHTLHFSVVAEGVEHEKQLTALAEMDCDEVQGFYFARPMTLQTFNQFIREMKEKAAI